MPIASVQLLPGVNSEMTPTLNQTGVSDSQLIRYRDGLIEKIGGWVKFYPFSVGSPVRDLHAWEDLNGVGYLGVGAEESLSVISEDERTVITPQTTTTNNNPSFSTTSTSATVTITDASITPNADNTIWLKTQVAVGGLVLWGVYPIQSVTGAHSYTITAASNASGTVSNGGAVPSFATTSGTALATVTLVAHGYAIGDTFYCLVSTTVGGITFKDAYRILTVPSADTFTIAGNTVATSSTSGSMNSGHARIVYYITIGPVQSGSGYGVGGYGTGGYGTGVSAIVGAGTPITATDWTSDNWGEIYVACPAQDAIYAWRPGTGYNTASIVETAPIVNGGIFIAMPQQILVAWGSSINGVQDPLLIRWSDVADYTNFTASTTNQAGSYRIPTGSRIVGGTQAPQQALIWTDVDLWSMQYIQPPYVFGFTKIMTGCGLLSAHAMGTLSGVTYWMSQGQFFAIGGGAPVPVPCPVWDVVFQDLDTANAYKVTAAVNSVFNEITWYYPSISGGTGEVDSYVKFDPSENAWDFGQLSRTAWIDQSVLGGPIGATVDGLLYQHEEGYDDDGAPIDAAFQTGYFEIGDGLDFAFVDQIWPDFKYGTVSGDQDAQLQVTIFSTNFPNQAPVTHGPYTVTPTRDYINCRIRGRQLSWKVESSDLGTFWRQGQLRYRWAQDGRR